MVTRLESCIADEVLALLAAKHLRHNEIQSATGINERTWRRYFVEQSRAIPTAVLIDVGDAIGVPAEEIIAAARTRLPDGGPAGGVEAALAGMSPEARAAVQDMRKLMGHDPEPEASPGDATSA